MSENEVVITTEKKKKKRGGAALILGGVALTAAVGGVFAYTGTININGDQGIELGGGVSSVSSCTSTANTSITQTYNGTNFVVEGVTVTGIASDACNGKTLEVRLANADGTAACNIYATGPNSESSPADNPDAFFTIPGPSGTDSFLSESGSCIASSFSKVVLTTSN